MSALEDKGFAAMAKSSTSSDAAVLTDLGAFGFNMAVIGLGTRLLSKHHDAGTDLMKLGTVLAGAGYGVRTLMTGKIPDVPLPKISGDLPGTPGTPGDPPRDDTDDPRWQAAARWTPWILGGATVPFVLYILTRK